MPWDEAASCYEDIVAAIGHTPLIRLNRVHDLERSEIWVKLERCNPGGSIKDRIGLEMVLQAEANGLLAPGGTIVEGTSGNTGMGLAMVAAQRGYRCVFTMPDKMSQDKVNQLRALGAEVVVCPTAVEKEDPRSYYSVAARLAEEIPGAWYPDQYSNLANPRAHRLGTGPEIWQQTGGEFTHFVATMGTGGTISGCGAAFQEGAARDGVPMPRMVGVDAVGSILKQWFDEGTLGEASTYAVEGFGEDFIPPATDFSVLDDIVQVDDGFCFRWARTVARKEGLFSGGSAGAAVGVAVQVAAEAEARGETARVVCILPDAGNLYLEKMYNDDWLVSMGHDPASWD